MDFALTFLGLNLQVRILETVPLVSTAQFWGSGTPSQDFDSAIALILIIGWMNYLKVSPLELRFTHDTVKDFFKPFKDGGVQRPEKAILDSIRELLGKRIPRKLECLDVCWHEGLLYVAGTGNRRLTMWRLLAIFRAGAYARIKVRVVTKDDPWIKFAEKHTTLCEGRWVGVRNRGAALFLVGRQREKDEGWSLEHPESLYDPGVQWKEARDLLENPELHSE